MINTIKKRKSVRTFSKQPFNEELITQINTIITEYSKIAGPFGHISRFTLIPALADGFKPGTYGIIKYPEAYIAGICENQNEALVDFGYAFEKIILRLTSLDLGTCWMGGTFKREAFKNNLNVSGTEMIPAVTPIGFPAEQRRLFEKGMRKVAGSDKRKPWEDLFFDGGFFTPLTKEAAGRLSTAFEMVRIGPSASNKQPWIFVLSEDRSLVHIFLNFMPGYAGNKMGFEMQRVDIGIAIAHFELACDELNISGTWEVVEHKVKIHDENLRYITTYHLQDPTD